MSLMRWKSNGGSFDVFYYAIMLSRPSLKSPSIAGKDLHYATFTCLEATAETWVCIQFMSVYSKTMHMSCILHFVVWMKPFHFNVLFFSAILISMRQGLWTSCYYEWFKSESFIGNKKQNKTTNNQQTVDDTWIYLLYSGTRLQQAVWCPDR